jgi:hypothetical protein
VFVALDIQHAKQMRRLTLSSVACMAVPHFITLSHKQHDFWGEKVVEHKVYVLISSANVISNFSHYKKKLAKYYYK